MSESGNKTKQLGGRKGVVKKEDSERVRINFIIYT